MKLIVVPLSYKKDFKKKSVKILKEYEVQKVRIFLGRSIRIFTFS